MTESGNDQGLTASLYTKKNKKNKSLIFKKSTTNNGLRRTKREDTENSCFRRVLYNTKHLYMDK